MQLHALLLASLSGAGLAALNVPVLNLNVQPGPLAAGANSFQYVSLADFDSSALCLDGSSYAVMLCLNDPNTWYIEVQGGGWCYDEAECLYRASTRLGSSSTWPAAAANMTCVSDPSQASVAALHYCDGASFSGYRESAWPVPGTNSSLFFRGIRNLDASLDLLLSKYGLNKARTVVFTGGSAGGLATFLHLDHVASRLSFARVLGQPTCGFFIDHAPSYGNTSYTAEMQYVYGMQNASGSLSPDCQAALAPESWKCIMAPYATPFITTPWFAMQSRFDLWQLDNILRVPCMYPQPLLPPYYPTTCNSSEVSEIQSYGPTFMEQFRPLMTGNKNGAFLDACIIHGSTNSSIDGSNNYEAFNLWVDGDFTSHSSWWTYLCDGSDSAGPCDPSPICAPF